MNELLGALLGAEEDSAPARSRVPFASFVAMDVDGVFSLKGGGLAMAVALDGTDTECMDAPEILDVTQTFQGAVGMLDERFRVIQYQIKRATGHLFSLRLAMVIVLDAPAPIPGIPSLLSERFSSMRAAASLDENVRELRVRGRRLVSHLAMLGAREMGAEEAFGLIVELVNYDRRRQAAAVLNSPHEIDFQACQSEIQAANGVMRIGSSLARILTLKSGKPELALPEKTRPDFLRGIREVPVESILVTEYKPLSASKAHEMFEAIAEERHRNKYKESPMTVVANWIGALFSGRDSDEEKPRENVVEVSAQGETEKAIKSVAVDGVGMGEFSMAFIVIAPDAERLDLAVSSIQTSAVNARIAMYEEESKVALAWLKALPGGPRLQSRRMTLSADVYGDLSLIFAPARGAQWNKHLNAPCLIDAVTRQQTPYFMNLNEHGAGEVHSGVMIGKTGAGKTYKCRQIVQAARDKYNALITIIDMKDSYEEQTLQNGGSYMRFGSIQANPLSMDPTRQNLEVMDNVVYLLAQQSGHHMNADELTEVHDEIAMACSVFPVGDDRRRIGKLLFPRPVRQAMEPWVGKGKYAWLFDHAEDSVRFAEWQGLTFGGFDRETMARIGQPFLYYALHCAGQQVLSPKNDGRFKLFLMDEAWLMLMFENESVREYVKKALKTWRENLGAVLLATQSGSDIENSRICDTIIESVATKLLLRNPSANRDWYQKKLGLNNVQVDLVLTGMKMPEEFLIVQDGTAKVLRLDEQQERDANHKVKEMAA